MKITVNGEKITLEKAVTVEELLVVTHAETPEYVTVQINDEFVDRSDFTDKLVNDGDTVEYLYFMGGGSL
ncbi:sulfur carrier protein ThiS [Pectinatus haikarae]|uniref:Sulfur carrier protein n=1 Tax=Pectinatus haikarae TaxID=349096 RepID=A0ABT9Y3B6_9FIRM|nr:sulfur carrier protein ThiS [Pectinatus haikarae]MDQ0202330.1 sulfur carrier protein [Pectinatus haikarae]